VIVVLGAALGVPRHPTDEQSGRLQPVAVHGQRLEAGEIASQGARLDLQDRRRVGIDDPAVDGGVAGARAGRRDALHLDVGAPEPFLRRYAVPSGAAQGHGIIGPEARQGIHQRLLPALEVARHVRGHQTHGVDDSAVGSVADDADLDEGNGRVGRGVGAQPLADGDITLMVVRPALQPVCAHGAHPRSQGDEGQQAGRRDRNGWPRHPADGARSRRGARSG